MVEVAHWAELQIIKKKSKKSEVTLESRIDVNKMMVKSGVQKIILKFHDRLQSCCCPEQSSEMLSWPGRLAGITKGHQFSQSF